MYKALILLGVLPSIAFAQVTPFLDAVGHPHEAQIELLHSRGVVEGYGYGIFRPDINLNRAEFLKMTMLGALGDDELVEDTRCFTDFVGEEQWFWKHACTAKEKGIINGYPDGSFRGTQLVNLVEALKMATEAWSIPLPTYSDTPADWYAPYIDIGTARGIFEYFPYNPNHLLTRSEMAWMLVGMNETIQYVDTQKTEGPQLAEDPVCGNGILETGEQCDDGNTENSDGCSSICIVVDEPIRHAALRIDQKTITSVSQAEGSEDVVLIAFDAIAGRQDLQMHELVFKADIGSLDAAKDYRLKVDTDGDGITDKALVFGSQENERVTFTVPALQIPDGASMRIEVEADLRSGANIGFVGLGFATDQPDYIRAVGTEDGRELTGIQTDGVRCADTFSMCWIDVTTQSPRIIGLEGTGNIYVTKHPTPVPSYQLLAGERTPVILALKLRAGQEDVRVSQISIGGGTDNIDNLELFSETSGTPFASATVTKCDTVISGRFCASTDLVVPKDIETTILVRANVKADTAGATSGDTVALSLTSGVSGAVAIEAEGVASSTDLLQNNSDSSEDGEIFIGRNTPGANIPIVGSTHDIVLAKIIAIENVHTDANESVVPAGESTVASFAFTAAEHNNSFEGLNTVILDSMEFTVTATNVEIDSSTVQLFNAADSATTVNCLASGTTGVITVACSNIDSSISGVIEEGEDVTLSLQMDILNPQVGGKVSTLQVSLNSLGSRNATGTIEWSDGLSSLEWVDLLSTSVKSTLYRTQ